MLQRPPHILQYIKYVSVILTIFSHFTGISPSRADFGVKDAEKLQIDGLTFSCGGCTIYRENFCKLRANGESVALPCSPDARSMLLQQTAQGNYNGSAPNKDELLKFLLKLPKERSDAKNALQLLLRTSDGEAVLKKETWFILSHYSDLLNDLLLAEVGEDDFWLLVAATPTKDSSEEQLSLRLSVMDKIPQAGLQPLIMSLAFDFDIDASFLDRARRIADQGNYRSAQGLKYTLDYIDSCSGAYVEISKAVSCEQRLLGADLWQEYLSKGTLRQAIRALRQKKMTTTDWIKYVAEVVPEQRMTAEVVNLTVAAFRRELKGKPTEVLFPSAKVEKLFEILQEKDRSFSDFVRGQKKTGVSTTIIVIVAVPLIILFVGSGWALLFWIRRRRELNSFNNDPFVADYAELKDLLQYFSVDINATSDELAKSFRVLAKEVHPDRDLANGEKFAKLKKKHDRARELLDKFHSA
ncbi:MAG: J domain-containing protein [Deltaproteobacteria bacterium]|nr:J domain-containing protein [Deltaproteobacteria bacterium]